MYATPGSSTRPANAVPYDRAEFATTLPPALQALSSETIGVANIDLYISAICHDTTDVAWLHPAFHVALNNLPRTLSLTDGYLSDSRALCLASLYLSVTRERGFTADGSLRYAALLDFIACRTRLPVRQAENLIGTDTPSHVFRLIRRYDGLPQNGLAFFLDTPDFAQRLTPVGRIAVRSSADDAHFQSDYLVDAVIDFEGRPLQNVRLSQANISGSLIKHALFLGNEDEMHAGLTQMQPLLERVTFDRCQWQKTSFRSTRFDRCIISESTFNNCDFRHASLTGTTINASCFSNSQFDYAAISAGTPASAALKFRKVTLQNCTLGGMMLEGIHFTDCSVLAIARTGEPVGNLARLSSCEFSRCKLDGLPAEGAIFDHVRFLNNTRASAANFRSARLRDIEIDKSQFNESLFADASLEDSVVRSGTSLESARFDNATLSNVTFGSHATTRNRINMTACDFHGAAFRRVFFVDCQLSQALFSTTRMTDTTFSRCQLMRADFAGSTGADFVTEGDNDLRSLRAWPARLGLSGEMLRLLSEPEHRGTMFDMQRYPANLLARILALPVPASAIPVFHLINDALALLALQGHTLDTVDDALLPILLRPSFRNDPAISLYIDERLNDGLLRISQQPAGTLSLISNREQPWKSAAAVKLALVISRLEDDQQVRQLSPLICRLLAGAENTWHLAASVREGLRERYCRSLPPALLRCFNETASLEPTADGLDAGFLLCLDGPGQYAIALPRRLWPQVLLNDMSQPHDFSDFLRFEQHGDVMRAVPSGNAVDAFQRFPLLACTLPDVPATQHRWLSLYQLDPALDAPFRRAFIRGERHSLIATEQQIALTRHFNPLMAAPDENKPAERDRQLLSAHILALQTIFADNFPLHENSLNTALLLVMIARTFFVAASADVFGSGDESPNVLRHYGCAALNSARHMTHLLTLNHEVYENIIDVAYGHDHAQQCAQTLAGRLDEAFDADPVYAHFKVYGIPGHL